MEKELIWDLIAKKLSGEASSDDLLLLESMLRKNPEVHYSLQTIIDIWDISPDSLNEAEKAFSAHLERMKKLNIDFASQKLPSENYLYEHSILLSNIRKNFSWLVLSIGILTGAFYFVSRYFYYKTPVVKAPVENLSSEVSTKNGSKTNIILPDGTKVWLNAGSKLTYGKEYGVDIREVSLSGEAFFDVQKNKEKPFIIHTNKIDIKVLGTVFNVKSYPNEKTTETSLVRGSIEVTFKDRPGQKVILKPNEKLIVSNNQLPLQVPNKTERKKQDNEILTSISHLNYSKADSTIIESAWVQNKLIFKDEPFSELALEMERWYNISIRFEDHSKEDMRFTGSFQKETVQQAFDALKLSGKFNYSINENEIVIYK